MGLMMVAERVLARLPAIRGAGVRLAVADEDEGERLSEDVLAEGSDVPVKIGDIRVRRASYPSM